MEIPEIPLNFMCVTYYVKSSDLRSKVKLPTTTHIGRGMVWDGGRVYIFLLGIRLELGMKFFPYTYRVDFFKY